MAKLPKRISQIALLAGLAWIFSAPARADTCAACAPATSPKTGTCTLPPTDPNYGKCQAACQKSTASSAKAASACSSACGADKGLQGKGAADAANSAGGVGSDQFSPQTGNAGNMCKNQQNQQDRAANANQPKPALQQCKRDADECKSSGGTDGGAGQACQQAEQALTGESANLSQAAAGMGAQCGKSDDNGKKMDGGQPPQIPPMQPPQNDKPQDTPPDLQPTETPEAEAKQTQKIETIKLGDTNAGGISMETGIPATSGDPPKNSSAGSGLSGSSASGAESFGQAAGMDTGKGPAAASAGNFGGVGSGGGLNSSGSSSGEKGVAGADIKPHGSSSGGYEMQQGGKSVLGLKGKSGEDDEAVVAQLAGVAPAKKEGAAGGASRAPGSSHTNDSRASADAGYSIFQMVTYRYRELRKVGEI